ncbi:hypothetical protein [Runella zeae]|uniref:hypothetical protein n=1 Tax=Runella zeae TaxID=94255 RepID=UPI0023565B26|nr:hypothetical protein [Runella zeae]
MTDRLKISIKKLYDLFAKYQGLSKLQGSPLYDDLETWNKHLRSKKLRELTDEDLSLFAGKVILTWGDENDYRFFLPRILELTAELKTPYDIWTLYSRLEDANWKTWNADEQTVINDFTIELWNNLLTDNSKKAEWEFKDYFHSISYFYPDFSEILKVWETNDSFASIKHLTNYIFEERQHLFDNNYIDSIEKNTKNIEQFKTWLTSDNILKKIENAFYDNEKSEIAERLSWVEQILKNEKKYST